MERHRRWRAQSESRVGQKGEGEGVGVMKIEGVKGGGMEGETEERKAERGRERRRRG